MEEKADRVLESLISLTLKFVLFLALEAQAIYQCCKRNKQFVCTHNLFDMDDIYFLVKV